MTVLCWPAELAKLLLRAFWRRNRILENRDDAMTILVFDSSAGKIVSLHWLSGGAFLLRNAKQGTFRKIGGPRNTSRMTNYANILAILSSVFEFVQEGNRFVNKLFDFVP